MQSSTARVGFVGRPAISSRSLVEQRDTTRIVGHQLRIEDLQRDRAPDFRIARAIDLADGLTADQFEQVVMSNGAVGHRE